MSMFTTKMRKRYVGKLPLDFSLIRNDIHELCRQLEQEINHRNQLYRISIKTAKENEKLIKRLKKEGIEI